MTSFLVGRVLHFLRPVGVDAHHERLAVVFGVDVGPVSGREGHELRLRALIVGTPIAAGSEQRDFKRRHGVPVRATRASFANPLSEDRVAHPAGQSFLTHAHAFGHGAAPGLGPLPLGTPPGRHSGRRDSFRPSDLRG